MNASLSRHCRRVIFNRTCRRTCRSSQRLAQEKRRMQQWSTTPTCALAWNPPSFAGPPEGTRLQVVHAFRVSPIVFIDGHASFPGTPNTRLWKKRRKSRQGQQHTWTGAINNGEALQQRSSPLGRPSRKKLPIEMSKALEKPGPREASLNPSTYGRLRRFADRNSRCQLFWYARLDGQTVGPKLSKRDTSNFPRRASNVCTTHPTHGARKGWPTRRF